MEAVVGLTVDEVVELAAVDTEFYCHHFFPNTFRQESPDFQREIFTILDSDARHVGLEVFRGGAKTTLLRAFTSKRIAYATSRTILYVSESQEHSIRSIRWLRRQIDRNKRWTETYNLSRGEKWSDTVIEIYNATLDVTITILAVGITGQTRGINVDDYRPDLIVVDDPCDEENTGTAEQREKTKKLFFGAIEKSLTPATENPDAMIVLLQTSLHPNDLINECHASSMWITRKFGVFDEMGESRWPQRFPTETLQQDKAEHIRLNQLSLWMREMECRIVSAETSTFKASWLNYYEELPESLVTAMGIDPVPPPSEIQVAKGMANKDYEVLAVSGYHGGKVYVCAYEANRGHEPEWTVAKFFQLVSTWNPWRVRLEAIAYQRVLKWILDTAMKKRKRFVVINAVADRRKKMHRIVQALSGIASAGRLYIHPNMVEFKEQFLSYPNTDHDDVLEAVAMSVDELLENPDMLEAAGLMGEDLEPHIPTLGAP